MTRPGTVAFTVCTTNHLPQAKALGDSLVAHNPGYRFLVVLLDRHPEVDETFFRPHRILHAGEMNIPAFPEMDARFTPYELSCAMKSFAARRILAVAPDCERLFYLDSDMRVVGRLSEAEHALEGSGILLTPHLVSSAEFEGRCEVERILLGAGVVNGGFLGLRRTGEAIAFLDWWGDRARQLMHEGRTRGIALEQMLLNFAPVMFPAATLLRNEGYNVAYWNLGERRISRQGDDYLVNGRHPLVLFHFSGFDFREGSPLTRFESPFTFENRPELLPLFEDYRRAVLAADPGQLRALPARCGRPAPVARPSIGQRLDAIVARVLRAAGRR
ncbi:MAG TPA: hypothetical protein PLL32_08115 [Anaeromyxobacteraceae bacterium]|nr:hypothetical protein [Anaeromyxobacteraceae bacterium]